MLRQGSDQGRDGETRLLPPDLLHHRRLSQRVFHVGQTGVEGRLKPSALSSMVPTTGSAVIPVCNFVFSC